MRDNAIVLNQIVNKHRLFGQHFTPEDIFNEYIFPEIKDRLYDYKFVDLFAGEGNLILPILRHIPEDKRVDYFKKHIFLFDIQSDLIDIAIKRAESYGISKEVAKQNIRCLDTLQNYPEFLLSDNLPVFHITNPPYLYIGYIKKHKETQKYLEYFQGDNKGYQDLYQIALINDLKHNIEKMIYIIPVNFIFSSSGANKIRNNLFKAYQINKAIIFEKKIFETTGVNVGIFFFGKKDKVSVDTITFEGLKISDTESKKRIYVLTPRNHYRAGNEFEDFVERHKAKNPLSVKFYLMYDEVQSITNHTSNTGNTTHTNLTGNTYNKSLIVVDANSFDRDGYTKREIKVSDQLFNKVKSNILYVRTIDTGSLNKRAGLYVIQEDYQADGIIVSKPYRTHPIQLFLEPALPINMQHLLKDYFNLVLEYLRTITDSEFMTTYKYSDSVYIRKYLGLSQVKKLIETFPCYIDKRMETMFSKAVKEKDIGKVLSVLHEIS
ncbi:MAG: N-6 DNA methylase [Candidatus Nanopusillus acidilobi]